MDDRTLVCLQVGVVIVEEAAEILECHVLTSLSIHTEHLIMIGDHKQLRPKCDSYQLTVESGSGHTLNISLFERLVQNRFPHSSLAVQHRMRPEISKLIRHTYPALVDHPSVLTRTPVPGLTRDVVFIDHRHLERQNDNRVPIRSEADSLSKDNAFEVQMLVSIVRYLIQQGLRCEDIVVLTPYLGQLAAFQREISKYFGVWINELDMNDLRTQLNGLPPKYAKKQDSVRVATIDNYQGTYVSDF